MNNELLLEDSIFKIGKVISVDGRQIRVKVDKSKNTSHLIFQGELLKNISVGGYIKIIKGFTKIVGKVEGEFINEDRQFSNKDYKNAKDKINRVLNVSLLGFFKGAKFERGVKELPLIDNECYLLQKTEFNQIHNFIKSHDEPISIGRLALEKEQEISVGVSCLFASHIGIFGNTGSGKSYTLAKIYREVFEKYKSNQAFLKNAQFFLIDFNGEYVGCDEKDPNIIISKKYKKNYRLSTRTIHGQDKYPIHKNMLDDPGFWTVFLEATEKTQAPLLNRALRLRLVDPSEKENLNSSVQNKLYNMVEETIKKKDKNLGTKVIYELFSDIYSTLINPRDVVDLRQFLTQKLGFNGTTSSYYFTDTSTCYHENLLITQLKEKIEKLTFLNTPINIVHLKVVLQYYDEIIKGHSNRDHLSPLIKRIDSRIKDLEKVLEIKEAIEPSHTNFTIVSLKDVNIHMRKILPLLLCKKLYDEKKEKDDEKTFLNIIIDEAHNILSRNSERESEQLKDYRLETFEEFIKEGRKFGVFLTVASQRPSDISSTIISQLHNYFLHRLINSHDIQAIEKTISYLDKVSFEYLPILPTGTCILAGLLAQVPVVVEIGKIDEGHEPDNKTMELVQHWKDSNNSPPISFI